MKDCILNIEIKNEIVNISAEKCSMIELAFMCGALEQTIGIRAMKTGKSLEDVKTNMLDIHLAAMENLTNQVINTPDLFGKGEDDKNGSK